MRNLLNASVSRVTTQIGCALFVRIVEPVAAAEIAMRPSPRNDGESRAVRNSRRQSERIPLRDPHDLSSKNPVLDRCDRVRGPLFFAVVAVRCAIRTTGLRFHDGADGPCAHLASSVAPHEAIRFRDDWLLDHDAVLDDSPLISQILFAKRRLPSTEISSGFGLPSRRGFRRRLVPA